MSRQASLEQSRKTVMYGSTLSETQLYCAANNNNGDQKLKKKNYIIMYINNNIEFHSQKMEWSHSVCLSGWYLWECLPSSGTCRRWGWLVAALLPGVQHAPLTSEPDLTNKPPISTSSSSSTQAWHIKHLAI